MALPRIQLLLAATEDATTGETVTSWPGSDGPRRRAVASPARVTYVLRHPCRVWQGLALRPLSVFRCCRCVQAGPDVSGRRRPECVGAVGVIEALVMLTQEVRPVIAPVGRAHDGVDVIGRGNGIVERHAGLVVELDEHHRAVDPVVEGPVVTHGPHPGEVGFVEMPVHLRHLHPAVTFAGPAGIRGHQGPQPVPLVPGQVGRTHAGVRHHRVVAPGAGRDPPILRILQVSWKIAGIDRRLQDRPAGLVAAKRADEAKASTLLGGEDHGARERAAEDVTWF